jgi:hypothetical protein
MTTDLETLRRLAIREAERQAELYGPLSPTHQRILDDFRRGEEQLGSILKMAERWAAEEKRFQEQAQALATLSWDHNPLLGADVERRLREAESIATLVDRADVGSPFNNWARTRMRTGSARSGFVVPSARRSGAFSPSAIRSRPSGMGRCTATTG